MESRCGRSGGSELVALTRDWLPLLHLHVACFTSEIKLGGIVEL